MTPQDFQPLVDLITASAAAYKAGGIVLALGVILFSLVKVLRASSVQLVLERLNPKLTWARWPLWFRMLFVFAVAAIGCALNAVASGTAVLAALPAAVVAGLVAMGVDGMGTSVAKAHSEDTKVVEAPTQNPT